MDAGGRLDERIFRRLKHEAEESKSIDPVAAAGAPYRTYGRLRKRRWTAGHRRSCIRKTPCPTPMSLSYGRNNKYEMTCYES